NARRSAASPDDSAVYVTPTNTAPSLLTVTAKGRRSAGLKLEIPLAAGLPRGVGGGRVVLGVLRVPSGLSGVSGSSRVNRVTGYGVFPSGEMASPPSPRLPTTAIVFGSWYQSPSGSGWFGCGSAPVPRPAPAVFRSISRLGASTPAGSTR